MFTVYFLFHFISIYFQINNKYYYYEEGSLFNTQSLNSIIENQSLPHPVIICAYLVEDKVERRTRFQLIFQQYV